MPCPWSGRLRALHGASDWQCDPCSLPSLLFLSPDFFPALDSSSPPSIKETEGWWQKLGNHPVCTGHPDFCPLAASSPLLTAECGLAFRGERGAQPLESARGQELLRPAGWPAADQPCKAYTVAVKIFSLLPPQRSLGGSGLFCKTLLMIGWHEGGRGRSKGLIPYA